MSNTSDGAAVVESNTAPATTTNPPPTTTAGVTNQCIVLGEWLIETAEYKALVELLNR